MAVEEGWQRRFPIVPLEAAAAARIIGQPVTAVMSLAGGLRNTNYRLDLASGPAVLRMYTAEAAACRRETRLLELLYQVIPVPRVLDARC
ncbi:MAG TPA: phosphotransferase, partial [Chloroflexota bacterium]|nr:phosphotransferase [Chloroflexota bacterium]